MPTYEFQCEECKKVFTKRLTIAEYEKRDWQCPKCASKKIQQRITLFQTKTSRKS